MKIAGLTAKEARYVEEWTDMIDARITVKKTGSGYRYNVKSWDIDETFGTKGELISDAKDAIYEWTKGDGIEFIMEITDLTEEEIDLLMAEREV